MKKLNHYAEEGGHKVDGHKLEAGVMTKPDYTRANAGLVIACHDVFIRYKDGILLVSRRTKPALNTPWPIGGRIMRGINTEDSLRRKVFKECRLRLKKIKHLGTARVLLDTDPFGHHKGSDAISIVYFAEGEGELKLDNDHYNPMIINKEDYWEIRKQLHPYVREYMDMAIQL